MENHKKTSFAEWTIKPPSSIPSAVLLVFHRFPGAVKALALDRAVIIYTQGCTGVTLQMNITIVSTCLVCWIQSMIWVNWKHTKPLTKAIAPFWSYILRMHHCASKYVDFSTRNIYHGHGYVFASHRILRYVMINPCPRYRIVTEIWINSRKPNALKEIDALFLGRFWSRSI